MTENPYQSPVSADEPPLVSTEERKRAHAVAKAPAVGLVGFSILSLMIDAIGIVNAVQWGGPVSVLFEMERHPLTISLAIAATLIAVHLFILFGALSMLKLRSLWFARTAAIAAIVPTTVAMCIGTSAGIWALAVLCLPHVTAEFDK